MNSRHSSFPVNACLGAGRRIFRNSVVTCVALLCLLCPSLLNADTFGDFVYTVADSQVTIDSYSGSATKLTIPDTIAGLPVTAIGSFSFFFKQSLTSITIPGSVTSIGYGAFNNCSGLTSVTLGDGVITIGGYAFANCSSLTSINIPDSVKTIGILAFAQCTGLKSVTLGDGGTSIENWAFQYCTGLTSLSLGKSVTSIGNGAFNECISLTSVTIPASVISIGVTPFYGSSGLTEIIVDSLNANYASLNGVLYDKTLTTLIEVPARLTSVTIPASVTSIGDGAFYGSIGLTSITIPASVTSIGDGAFGNCTNLTEIAVNSGNVNYASLNGALYNKTQTTLIAVPGSLTGFIIPDGVTFIGTDAFERCSRLTSVSIPSSVTSVGRGAFYYCTGLTSVTIPDSVTSIGNSAFACCTGLASVKLGGGVTAIGDCAFNSCSSLTAAIFHGNAPTMGSEVFTNAASDFNIYFPTGATGYDVSPWTSFTTHVYTLTAGPAWSDSFESIFYPDWYESTWYGWIYQAADFDGWIYSSTQGWQYVSDGNTADSVYVYDIGTGSWLWTSDAFWPYFYDYADNSWYCFVEGTTPSRSFYSYKTASLVSESAMP